MKKIFFPILFVILSFAGKAQNKDMYSITAIQAGTISLTSKSEKIFLTDEVKVLLHDQLVPATYYVIFTPVDGAALPSLSNKNDQYFLVTPGSSSAAPSAAGSVDYIVFVKRNVTELNRKMLQNKQAAH